MTAEEGRGDTEQLVSVARTDQTDAALAEAFTENGDNGALVELVRRHQIGVFRRLTLELSDPDQAEVASEKVFVVASQRLGEWSRETELRQWLFEIVDELKEDLDSEPSEDSPRLTDPAIFFRQAVHRALRSLPEGERKLLLAIDLEGRTVEQVADERGESVERMGGLLEAARDAFRASLQSRPEADSKADPLTPRLGPGDVLDRRYRIDELLGEGGMAAVFKAEHLGIKRIVAVKTLHPERRTQAMIRERFVREAQVLGRLQHPNFVDISDSGENRSGVAYLVMELLHGEPLSAEIARSGRIGPVRALRLICEIARGLQHAHDLGIIHRDIKPDNIVVLYGQSEPGFAKILDLGVATSSDGAAEENSLYGTPPYMAPEQIKGARIDGRVDLYAVGITLFEMLTGERPFQGATFQYVLAQHLTTEPPLLRNVCPEIEHEGLLQTLVTRCLAKAPRDRFRNATELLEAAEGALERIDQGEEEEPYVPPARDEESPLEREPPPPSTRTWWPWVALALLVGAALGGWLWLDL